MINGSIYGYLQVFHAIANEGSIVGASRRLQLASPSVSQSLKLLEQHLGLPLFSRTTRKMELTEAGKRLRAETAQLMLALNNAVENVQDLGKTAQGLVRITLSRFAFLVAVQPYYAEFCERYPEIQLEISTFDGKTDLLQENFDLGIRFGHHVAENMVSRQLLPACQSGLYVSSAYAQKYGIPQTPEELSSHKLIGYRFISSNRIEPLVLEKDGQKMTVAMPSQLICNDIETMHDAVRQGMGIGRIFTNLHRLQADFADFIPILPDYWENYPPLHLYYLQHASQAKRVKVLIDFLLEKNRQG